MQQKWPFNKTQCIENPNPIAEILNAYDVGLSCKDYEPFLLDALCHGITARVLNEMQQDQHDILQHYTTCDTTV